MTTDDEPEGDDVCDICLTSNVNASCTTYFGKTIGIECGCDDKANACECEECVAENGESDADAKGLAP